jgi:formylglycine-generating enzyme
VKKNTNNSKVWFVIITTLVLVQTIFINTAMSAQYTRESIKQVQRKLNEQGYPVGTADGVMGKNSRGALRSYQKAKGLTITGKLNKEIARTMGLILKEVKYGQTFRNHLGMKFVTVPTGSFYMGSCGEYSGSDADKRRFMGLSNDAPCPSGKRKDSDARQDEFPQHKVIISQPFQLAIYEVTVSQFKRYIASTGMTSLLTDDFIKANRHGNNTPVSEVSWDDVQKYIQWLNRTKPSSDRGTYALPTEAQWEYACRSKGKNQKYCGGNNIGALAWYSGNAGGKPHPVGRKNANGLGVYDMSGNVWEWTQDRYGSYSSGTQRNPKGKSSGSFRVSRGGSWRLNASYSRSAFRYSSSPDNRYNRIGFRLRRTSN